MSNQLDTNPWFAIWVKPRETIQKIIDHDANYRLGILCAIYGFVGLLNLSQSWSLGFVIGFIPIIVLAAVLSPLWGYIAFSVPSFFIFFTGKWFKGRASYQQVRSAMAWSSVPILISLIIWIIFFFMYGKTLFQHFDQSIEATYFNTIFLFSMMLIQFIVGIWALVIYINALAQVQQFSIIRSILNIIVGGLLFAIILGSFIVLLAFLFSEAGGA